MEKILKLFILTGLIAVTGCKPQQQVIRNTSVTDTIITHKSEVIQLPVKSITIIKEPCKDQVLQPIHQTITSGNTHATISTENGNLQVQISTDSTSTINQSTTAIHSDSDVQTITKTTYKTPKWAWYALVYSIAATLWLLRKPIFTLIKSFML